MTYNNYCKSKSCEHYIEWEFDAYEDEQPYGCTSCKLQGQSYDITEIAHDCPFRGETMPKCEECSGLACGDECDGRSNFTPMTVKEI